MAVDDAVPHALGLRAVGVDERARQLVDSSAHRRWEAVDRRALAAHGHERVDAHGSDGFRVESPETRLQRRRPVERPLHRHLLVEEHADEQGEPVAVQQGVGGGVAGDEERPWHRAQRSELRGGGRWSPRRRRPASGAAGRSPAGASGGMLVPAGLCGWSPTGVNGGVSTIRTVPIRQGPADFACYQKTGSRLGARSEASTTALREHGMPRSVTAVMADGRKFVVRGPHRSCRRGPPAWSTGPVVQRCVRGSSRSRR